MPLFTEAENSNWGLHTEGTSLPLFSRGMHKHKQHMKDAYANIGHKFNHLYCTNSECLLVRSVRE